MRRQTLGIGAAGAVAALAVATFGGLYVADRLGADAGSDSPGFSERLAAEQTVSTEIRADGSTRSRVHLTFELLQGDRPPTLFLTRPYVPDPVDTPSVAQPVDVTGLTRIDTRPVELTMDLTSISVRRPGGSAEVVGASRIHQDDMTRPGWRLAEPMGGWSPGRYAVDLDVQISGGAVDPSHVAVAVPTWAPGGVGGESFTTRHEITAAGRQIEAITCLSSSTPTGPPVDCGEPGRTWQVTPMGLTDALLVTLAGKP